jgi:hypothetical protein
MVEQELYQQYFAIKTRLLGMKPWEEVKFTNFAYPNILIIHY